MWGIFKKADPSCVVHIPGPEGPLEAAYLAAEPLSEVAIVIVPGSGPTDRDGNNQLGLKSNMYKLMAEDLAARGVASLRIDKRGMFGSRAAIQDANKVSIKDYADDVSDWAKKLRELGHRRIYVLAHSEGGLVALKAALNDPEIDGLILVAAAGRPIDVVFEEQLNLPQNATIQSEALKVLTLLRRGETVSVQNYSDPIKAIFKPELQAYWRDLMRHDPKKMIADISKPILIIQGDKDIQVHHQRDGEALALAQPKARYVCLKNANHMFKLVETDDLAANFAAYAKPKLPLVSGFVDEIVEFVE